MQQRMLIDGELVEASRTFDNVNPATEEVLGQAPDASADDVARAVAAARRAFDETDWSRDHAFRARCLRQLQEGLQRNKEELRATMIAEGGIPAALTFGIQCDEPVGEFGYWAELAEGYEYKTALPDVVSSMIPSRGFRLREPVGVAAAITPFNFPLHQALFKIGPALAAGCTVVHKPAPQTPWTGTIVARIAAEETDIPAGVLNVITGAGDETGVALVADPGVDLVSFTGSTAAGKHILASAANDIKRVHLELGGKSASIVLDDADLPLAITFLSSMACAHSGQACARHTRMLLPRSRYDEGVALATAIFGGLKPGDPTDPATLHGPQVSAEQRDLVLEQIDRAIAEGAKLAAGGGKPTGFDRGYWVEPTLLVDVDPTSRMAREEIFGPVLQVLPYDDTDDAIRIANDSPYGLSGGVWSTDEARALDVASRIRTGTVGINMSLFVHPKWPFGGYKQSGLGREGGIEGFEAYLETKLVSLPGA